VVDREDLVIHDPFNYVEQAPPDQQPPETGPAADSRSPVGSAPPKNPDAHGDCDPRRSVEEAVPKRVRLQTRHRRFGVVAHAREHVVPLKHLVKKDAVHQPAQADAEQDSGGAGARDSLGAGLVLANVPTGIDSRSREGRVPAGDARLNAHSGDLSYAFPHTRATTICLVAGRAGTD